MNAVINTLVSLFALVALGGGVSAAQTSVPATLTPDSLLARARQSFTAGDYASSAADFNRAMRLGADSVPCLQGLADVAMATADYDALMTICPLLRRTDQWLPYIYNYEAQAATALGQLDTAANRVVQLVYLVGIDNDAYEAMTTVADRDLNLMADRFRQEKGVDPSNPVWDECLGTIFTYARLYNKAVDAYLSALRLDPRSDADAASLAMLYNQMRQYDNALHFAAQAINLNPYYLPYVSDRAVILRNAGKSPDAIAMLSERIDADSASYAPFLIDRGMLLASSGNYPAAVSDYDAALRLEPASAVALLRKGIALKMMNETARADSVFRQVVSLGYRNWSGTALAQAYLGNRQAVDEYIDATLRRQRRADNYFSLAAMSDVLGRTDDALRYIDLALRDNALNPDVIAFDQSLRNVRSLPAFAALMRPYTQK